MIGSYSAFGGHRRRGRRRGSWSALRFLLGMAGVAAVGGYGYQVGLAANLAWTDRLEADLQRVQQDNMSLRGELALEPLHRPGRGIGEVADVRYLHRQRSVDLLAVGRELDVVDLALHGRVARVESREPDRA